MKKTIVLAAALVALAAAGALQAQAPAGFKRTELQRHDLATPGREVVMARVEFNPGAVVPKHTHPGEEIAYVLEGELSVELEGKPPVTIKAGDSFFVPAGTIHTAKNPGKTATRVVSTYVIEKGKPLATPVK